MNKNPDEEKQSRTEEIHKAAEDIRGHLSNKDILLWDQKVDLENADETIVAAYCLGAKDYEKVNIVENLAGLLLLRALMK